MVHTTTAPNPPIIKIIKTLTKKLAQKLELRRIVPNSETKLSPDIAIINTRYNEIESQQRDEREMAMAEGETFSYVERIKRVTREEPLLFLFLFLLLLLLMLLLLNLFR